MANPENVRETEQPNHAPDRARSISIQATPFPDTGVIFQKAPDGGLRIAFQGTIAIQGAIAIDLPPAMAEAAGAALSTATDVGYRLLPKGTPPPSESTPAS